MGEREHIIEQITALFGELTWHGRQLLARRVAKHGLTPPQFIVLQTLERCGSQLTLGEIADALQLPASSLTSIADRLVARGLATRDAVPEDRRAVALTITGAGQAVVEAVDAERRQELASLLQDAPVEDLRVFVSVLQTISAGLERLLAGGGRQCMDHIEQHEGEGVAIHGTRSSGNA
jgi:DNA-binding MarR family transcriptional regulator